MAVVVVETTTSETNVVVITITGRHHLNKNNVFLHTVQVIHLKTPLICTTEMQSTGTEGITEVHPVDVDERQVVVTEEEITISSTGMRSRTQDIRQRATKKGFQ